MVEAINAVCPGCKKTFAVPAEYENKKVKCKCGQVFIAAKKLTEPKEPVSIESARGKPSHNKSVIVLGVIAVSLTLILSVFLMWLFVFRDKWGNDNSPKIRQEADKLVKLQTLESKAQSFIENGDLQNGIAKYQEALDFISENQTNNPKFTEAMGRISLAKREATELLEEVNKKKEVEQKLDEQKQRLANMRATVNGGAWLTRKSGNSEPIRGLNIEAIKSQGRNDQLLAILQASLEFRELDLKLNMELKNDKETRSNLIESTQKCIEELQEEIRTISRDRSAAVDMLEIRRQYFINDLIAELSKKVLEYDLREKQQDKWIALNKAYMKIRITWETICLKQLVGSTHTGVDGKYQIDLPVGSYYLYAAFESEYSRVDWFIPLQVLSNEEIKVDFCNENAYRIDNKDTSL